MIILTEKQKEMLKNIDTSDMKRWREFKEPDKFIDRWDTFWYTIYKGAPHDRILDYGCGPGYCEFIGHYRGFRDITSLDIDNEEVRRCFKKYTDILDIKVHYWDNIKLPFKDGYFDSIVSKSSILKLSPAENILTADNIFINQINELVRVSRKNCKWYIAPVLHAERLTKKLKDTLMSKVLKNKAITIVPWLKDLKG